jgi:hypothetical protein
MVKARRPSVPRLAKPALRAKLVLLVCLYLVQRATAERLQAVQPVMRLLRQGHGPVCLLDQAKLVPHPWPEPLGLRQLLPAGFHPPEPRRESAEEYSSDFQF